MKIRFYPEGDAGPVRDHLEDLADARPAAYVKLALDLQSLGAEGVRARQASVRALGRGLWELKRRFEGIQYRIFFCVEEGSAWLLHSIEKKSARTPPGDLCLARRRMKGVAS